MDALISAVTSYIEQHSLLPLSGTIVVAVSGGADSLCLLHVLHQLCGVGKRYPLVKLHVAHLNHLLRPDVSASEAEHVTRLAESWGLPVTIGVVDVPELAQTEHRSLEDAARIARYRFLRDVAQEQQPHLIAVAHHQDDQVETLLLHWLRGGGLASMIGLQPRQQDIIRPLLCITHADTVAYCQQYQLPCIEDASNSDPRFLRNRIRHELLPLLESMNPGIRATLVRNAEVVAADMEWIEQQIAVSWSSVIEAESKEAITIRIPTLLTLPLSLQRHLLRMVTARLCMGQSPLELRHYILIEQLVQDAYTRQERTLHLPGQLHAVRMGDQLVIARHRITRDGDERDADMSTSLSSPSLVSLPIPGTCAIPGTSWLATAEYVPETSVAALCEAFSDPLQRERLPFVEHNRYVVYIDADSIAEPLQVRVRRAGDRIRPLGMAQEKKVQDVLVDKHVPRAERATIPLFFSRGQSVWLAGVCLDDRVRLSRTTQRIVRLAIVPLPLSSISTRT